MRSGVAFVILCLAASGTEAQSAHIRRCGGSAKVDISKIQVSGCNKPGDPCHFVKGRSARIVLPFTPATASNKVTAQVNGILANIIPVPFQLPNADGCSSGLHCPLTPGTPQTYINELPVSSFYPSINVGVEWKLLDERNNELVCIRIPVTLVDYTNMNGD
ncbi:Phosphatidylglycerol/phosphatidylinositol transfer protein [Halocaridina rubra]|uniref:Phosphatidylglycerol/phosphatidylinositol transfer protein n=1 Tax=Halocaridina rubra TaxID=373956 RepID=A0AAN9A483_HALRR